MAKQKVVILLIHMCTVECKIKSTQCNYNSYVITICSFSVIYSHKNDNAQDLQFNN